MVLESIYDPKSVAEKPSKLLIPGIIFPSIALWVSRMIFPQNVGFSVIFLTTLVTFPLILEFLKIEERKIEVETETGIKQSLFEKHNHVIKAFTFFFVGSWIAFSFWFALLPSEVSKEMFLIQIDTIEAILGKKVDVPAFAAVNANIAINTLKLEGSGISRSSVFFFILANNLKVLIISTLFSFLFGTGALFILLWNSSVIGVAVGNSIREKLSYYAQTTHLDRLVGYFHTFPFSFLSFAIHGVPELISFFLGGLAGGILSVAVIKHKLFSENFNDVLKDSLDVFTLAIGVLLLAALLEVTVSPAVKSIVG